MTHPPAADRGALWLAIGSLLLAGCAASTLPSVHSEPERLALGRDALVHGKPAVAVELLKTYVANNPGGAEVDEATELLGEAHLKLKQWVDAQTQFERVVRDYPESDSSAAAAYHLGEALWGQARSDDFDQDFTKRALEQWESYLRGYPGHWANGIGQGHVAVARTRLANKLSDAGELYLRNGLLEPARKYFQRVLDEYADTARRANAELGIATIDAKQGHRAEAIAGFRAVEQHFPGSKIAREAAARRGRLERHR